MASVASRCFLGALVACGLAVPLLLANVSVAAPCGNPSGLTPCIDSDALWLTPGPSAFSQLASARSLAFGQSVTSLGLAYADGPLGLRAPAPDPDGRRIEVVNHTFNASLLWAAGIGGGWDLGLALPLVLAQSGAGFQGATEQAGPALPHSAPRDPRLEAGYALADQRVARDVEFYAKAGVVVALPFGDERALAGEALPVVEPRLVLTLAAGPFFAGSELGLRLRAVERVGSATWGHQALIALGVGVQLLPQERLTLAVESWLAPVLVSQALTPEQQTTLGRTSIQDAALTPAEWLATLRLQVAPDAFASVALGTGLPLSSHTLQLGDAASEQQHFAGMTAPRWRAVLAIRALFGGPAH